MNDHSYRFPAYRIAAHYEGQTHSWPVPADRIVDALANRLSKITPDLDLDRAESDARIMLKRTDGNGGQEVESEGDRGVLWLTAIDPGTADGRDLLGAIGVTSYAWPA